MKSICVVTILLVCLSAACANAQSDGYQALLNGKDLTGWSYLPTTKAQKKTRAGWQKSDPNAPPWPIVESKINFDGKSKSEDNRFVVTEETLVVSVPEEGRKVQMLYSDVDIKGDFELRLEFRASENADSGVFIRGKQLQCRDYPNAGPYRKLKKFKSNDWNELVVIVSGRTARCTCNGEVLEKKFKVPAKGPIGVEGDRGKFEYRNIRVKQKTDNMLKPTNEVKAWRLEQFEGGKLAMKADGDTIVFETSSVGKRDWDVQAYQTGLELEEGAEYKVSFEVKANTDKAIVSVQASITNKDWHNIGLFEDVALTQEFQSFEYTFFVSDSEKDNRIGFIVGGQTGVVTVRNFKLVLVE